MIFGLDFHLVFSVTVLTLSIESLLSTIEGTHWALLRHSTARLKLGCFLYLVSVLSFVFNPSPGAWTILALGHFALVLMSPRPYQGGSDAMLNQLILALGLGLWIPKIQPQIQLYLGFLLVCSYFFSGLIKVRNPDWRRGQALAQILSLEKYAPPSSLKSSSECFRMSSKYWGVFHSHLKARSYFYSWVILIFELGFPLFWFFSSARYFLFFLAMGFHLVNAKLFGLNRFLWIWLCYYCVVFEFV